uniref:Uncharacterized protein n=1 Tax=Rhizophagus irregularis (strain DAOM 181602 / DAOM 197198 / MUCL 43194) TaxID=747089 RepID=U9TGW3_RHIID
MFLDWLTEMQIVRKFTRLVIVIDMFACGVYMMIVILVSCNSVYGQNGPNIIVT